MSLFINFIKEKRSIVAVNLLIAIFFSISFYLYRLPLTAVFYPFIVCFFIQLVFAAISFRHYKQRHDELVLTKQNIDILTELSIKSCSYKEQSFINIINTLIKQKSNAHDDFNSRLKDTIQYYTVWVHQIKTPIASMRLLLQNEDSALSRKLSTDLSKIERYVQMVMVYLRINSDNTDYLFVSCSLDNLIKQAVKSFSTEFIEKKLELIYEPLDKEVVIDEKWFLFLLEQIISNALKYTQKGYIKIYLSSEGSLCIEDSGIGITAQDLPRIFENGYTGNIGRIYKKSSGIGLYLCKTVCDKLNLSITAASEPGKGTTIKIAF